MGCHDKVGIAEASERGTDNVLPGERLSQDNVHQQCGHGTDDVLPGGELSQDNVHQKHGMHNFLPGSEQAKWPGLLQPQLDSGAVVTGATKHHHRVENKRRRRAKQSHQGVNNFWSTHEGNTKVSPEGGARGDYRGQMCPTGLALDHPAANVLLDYAKVGCPVNSGQPWTLEMMEAAIDKGPHSSALDPERNLP